MPVFEGGVKIGAKSAQPTWAKRIMDTLISRLSPSCRTPPNLMKKETFEREEKAEKLDYESTKPAHELFAGVSEK